MEYELLEFVERVAINTYERGISTYSVVEISSNGDKREYNIELSGIHIENDIMMFVGFDGDIVKSCLVSTINSIKFFSDPELYKLSFTIGWSITIIPIK